MTTKPPKPKKLKISLSINIEGEEGMNQFARMLKVLHDNGFEGTVRQLLKMLVEAARKHGAAVPPDIEAMTESKQ